MKIQVLFPASPPLREERYRQARATAERELPEITLLHPRLISARDSNDPLGYLAGDDALRSSEIVNFLKDPECAVAWFGRGGYGLTRILSRLEEALGGSRYPHKRWLGYSDLTALFAFAKAQSLEIQSIHGPMLCAFPEQPNQGDIAAALRGEPVPIRVHAPQPGLQFQGSIWGGNLAVLASLCGTPWLPTPASDQAVFLEDVGEAPYRVDRFLTQLHDSGFFARTRRVFLGTFTEHEPAEHVLRVAQERCRQLGLQVLGELPAGHSEPHSPIFLDFPYRYSAENHRLEPA